MTASEPPAARLEIHPQLVAGFGSSVPKAVKHLPPLRSVQTVPLASLGDWPLPLLSFHIQAPERVSSFEYQSDLGSFEPRKNRYDKQPNNRRNQPEKGVEVLLLSQGSGTAVRTLKRVV